MGKDIHKSVAAGEQQAFFQSRQQQLKNKIKQEKEKKEKER